MSSTTSSDVPVIQPEVEYVIVKDPKVENAYYYKSDYGNKEIKESTLKKKRPVKSGPNRYEDVYEMEDGTTVYTFLYEKPSTGGAKHQKSRKQKRRVRKSRRNRRR